MRVFARGDSVTFKSDHGTTVSGIVYDCNEVAVMISTNFGMYSVDPSKILSGGTWKIIVNNIDSSPKRDDSFDIGWWDSLDEDGDTF